MTVQEYDKMMEEKGTPKVWSVRYAFTCPGMIHSKLFKTEAEAKNFSKKLSHVVSVGETWDIWNWTARH